MGIKLSSLEVDTPITLNVSTYDNHICMDATIKQILRDDLALITIYFKEDQILNFENCNVQVEYCPGDDIPYIWKVGQIIYHQSEYVLKVYTDGTKKNRRECFRVGVGRIARMKSQTGGSTEIMVKDVSLSGFALTDRKEELNLQPGEKVSISFEDLGHELNLVGRLVRIEQREQMTIYGFEICNLCKDLPSYVTCKQRQKGSS